MSAESTLTPKALQTRRRIFEAAMALFAGRGYEATTMRDIASAAECSPGLTYRYFARKEDLVLELYRRMAAATAEQVAALPADATIAERFHAIMRVRFDMLRPYRDALAALFGVAMNPGSEAGVLGTNSADIQASSFAVFEMLVNEASDVPKPEAAAQLAMLLYSLHFLIILFWFYDRTPDQSATGQLLDFSRDMLKLARGMLIVPFVAQAMARMSGIVGQVFGVDGERPAAN